MTSASHARSILDGLLDERRLARRTPLGVNTPYMADLEAEIAVCHATYVAAAVTSWPCCAGPSSAATRANTLRGRVAAFHHSVRIRYQECDMQGVVYFARYPEYYDISLTELFRAALGSYQSMVESGVDMVVAEQSLRYRSSARFDDVVDVAITIDRLGETSMLSSYEITRDGELVVEGDMRHVFIDVPTKEKRPMPDAIRAALQAYGPDA